MNHPDKRVNDALLKLADALCEFERNTGRRSILILREEGGHRTVLDSGKPADDDAIPDEMFLSFIKF